MEASFLILEGKVAIVTGSSSGIGRAVARRFAAEGARVTVCGLPDGRVQQVVEEIRSQGGEAVGVEADLGFAEEVDRVFGATLKGFGRLDILVNNAGWASPIAHFLELDEEHWDRVIRTNLKSVYLCTSRAAKIFVEQGGGGCVISTSSFGAERAHRMMAAYDATKGGINAFTRTVAIDLAPFGIRVNAVGPGAIHTEEYDGQGEEAKRKRAETVPLGRVGYPDDVAGTMTFLASEDASYITGQVVYVDGGILAQVRSPQVDAPLPESVRAQLRTRG